jgi:hypothetical protein
VVTVGGGGGGWGQCHRHCLARRWINEGDDGEIRVRVLGCRGGDMLARLEGTQRAGAVRRRGGAARRWGQGQGGAGCRRWAAARRILETTAAMGSHALRPVAA